MKFTHAVDLLIHNLEQIIEHFVTDSESDLKDLDPDGYEIVRDANRYARKLRRAMEKMPTSESYKPGADHRPDRELLGLDYVLALTSSELIHTPGILKWAMVAYRSPSKADREAAVRTFEDGYSLPRYIARGLVSGELPFTLDGDKVVINIKIDLGHKV